jgi:hypothetical protein
MRVKYVPNTPGSPNAIRRFNDAAIEQAMFKALSNLRPGKTGAVVAYADMNGVKGAVYKRSKGNFFGLLPPGEWSYVGTLGVNYKGQLDGSAAVMYDW